MTVLLVAPFFCVSMYIGCLQIMKRLAKERRDAKSGVMQSTKNRATSICLFAFNLSSVYNCLPVLKSTTMALRYLIVNTAQFNSPTKVLLNSMSIYGCRWHARHTVVIHRTLWSGSKSIRVEVSHCWKSLARWRHTGRSTAAVTTTLAVDGCSV